MNESHTPNREDLSDHDLLVRLDERVEWLIDWSRSHETAHRRVKWGVIGAMVTAIAAATGAGIDYILRR